MEKMDFGVVGLGRMGANHVRVLSELPGLRLVAVCDANRELAEKTRQRYLALRAHSDVREMLAAGRLDAVVIAVPTSEHLRVAQACLTAGVSVLVEKPLAPSEGECDEMLGLAKRLDLRLMTGHIERFNPVIAQIKEYLDQGFLGDTYYVETVRSGPFPKRLYGSKDGVVIDLAVHDLDLVAHLFGPLEQLYANHILAGEGKQDIHARVLYKTHGMTGSSQFSWISPRKERSMTVYGDKGILIGNLIDQEIWYYENGDVEVDYSDNYYQNVLMGRVSEGKVVKFPIKKEEPLRAELAFFLRLLQGGASFDPTYGKLAVRYAKAMLESAENDRIVRL